MIYEPFDYVHHKNKILNKMATVVKVQTEFDKEINSPITI